MISWIGIAAFWYAAWYASNQCVACGGARHLSWIEHRALTVLGMLVFPLMFTYAFAHIVSVRAAVHITFSLFVLYALITMGRKRTLCSLWSWGTGNDTPPPWLRWSCIALMVAVLPFFLRSLATDAGTWNRYPLAMTIAEGNVPVRTPVEPDQIFSYHFGPEFFEGMLHAFSGVSLPFAYSSLLFVCFLCVLFTSLALLRRWNASWGTAFVGGLFCLFAGGWMWLNGVYWLQDMYHFFFLRYPMAFPFARFNWLFLNNWGASPLIMNFLQPTVGLGSPIFLGCLLLFSLGEEVRPRKMQWMLGIFLLMSISALALCMESTLVLLVAGVVCVAALRMLQAKKQRQQMPLLSSPLLWGACIAGLCIVIIQGGVLTGAFVHVLFPATTQTMGSLIWNPRAVCFLWSLSPEENPQYCLTVFAFARDFGLCLIIHICCFLLIIRKKIVHPSFCILTVAAVPFFLLPFFFSHPVLPRDVRRLWTVYVFLMTLVTPLVLQKSEWAMWLFPKKWLRSVLICAMTLSALLYVMTHTLIPDMRFHAQPLFASLKTVTPAQSRLYAWIRKSTDQKEYFYQYTSRDYEFEQVLDNPRYLLMVNTGRFSIGPYSIWGYDPAWMEQSFTFEEHCSLSVAHNLRIRYLLLEGAKRHQWFQSHCLSSDWTVAYQDNNPSYPVTLLKISSAEPR